MTPNVSAHEAARISGRLTIDLLSRTFRREICAFCINLLGAQRTATWTCILARSRRDAYPAL
jgi:hypothetical protein